ncbi:hypothetical protein TL16_g08408 [Triparma laevis f. inornata]|uniref:Uncharacterized protein n=1 Tax=Triparma laevis f. inornata TaxID=1714386 RepID=A0A9W7B2V3_9STRA|nr:hypothetical protein TL16_g08408 [Triparma laevis f. inornata]
MADGATTLAVAAGVKSLIQGYFLNGGLALIGSEVLFVVFMFLLAKNVGNDDAPSVKQEEKDLEVEALTNSMTTRKENEIT